MNEKDHYGRQFWIITGANYGSFAFYGTELQAERKRAEKATWEHEIFKKRLAVETKEDIEIVKKYYV